MKFNKHISPEIEELLTTQYKKYIKETPMTKKGMRALREWVKDGHSVYENTCDAWADGQIPIEFLTIYRDEEYIRQNTKGMSSEESQKFALAYYGWDDNEDESADQYLASIPADFKEPVYANTDEELPFS